MYILGYSFLSHCVFLQTDHIIFRGAISILLILPFQSSSTSILMMEAVPLHRLSHHGYTYRQEPIPLTTIIAEGYGSDIFQWVDISFWYQSFNLCYTTDAASTIIRWWMTVWITTQAGTTIYTPIRIYRCCQHYITSFIISSTGYTQISSKLFRSSASLYQYLVTQRPNHSSCVRHALCIFLVTYGTNVTYWVCDPFTQFSAKV